MQAILMLRAIVIVNMTNLIHRSLIYKFWVRFYHC